MHINIDAQEGLMKYFENQSSNLIHPLCANNFALTTWITFGLEIALESPTMQRLLHHYLK